MKNLFTLLLLLLCANGFAQTAPNFTIVTSDGQSRNLYNDFLNQGKIVVIEAFFTTCPPCNTHAPFWQALYESQLAAHPGQVEFLLLSTLQSDNNFKVAQYKTAKNLTMPGAGTDGGGLTALQPYITGQFGEFQGTPTFIIIYPDGEVEFDVRGATPQITMDMIAQSIAAQLTQSCAIESPFGNPVSNIQISATTPTMTANISASGTYSLSNVPQLQNTSYTISATKMDADPLQGVSTFDLVRISKHILGLDTFVQDWQKLAADMNCNGMVTTYDIVLGRQLILGVLENLPCSPWKFIPQGSNVQSNGNCVDLMGVKLGDLTGPYFAPPPSDRGAFALRAADRYLHPGEQYRLDLRPEEWFEIQGLQIDLGFDPNVVQINNISAPGLPGFDATCYNLHAISEGHLPVVWVDGATATLPPNDALFSIELTALQGGQLSDMLRFHSAHLPAEIYDTEISKRQMDLRWISREQEQPIAGKIFPNPTRSMFQVYYDSPEGVDVLVQVADMNGKIVLEKTFQTSKGANYLSVQPGSPTPGLHVVKVNGRHFGNVLLGM